MLLLGEADGQMHGGTMCIVCLVVWVGLTMEGLRRAFAMKEVGLCEKG